MLSACANANKPNTNFCIEAPSTAIVNFQETLKRALNETVKSLHEGTLKETPKSLTGLGFL